MAHGLKHFGLQKAANVPPVVGKKVGIVTGGAGGRVMSGKSPKVSGHISAKTEIGRTQSGKVVHNEPGHEAHTGFSKQDHFDAYKLHAQKLSKLDPSDTHPDLIAHHKTALNTHFKLGSGMQKSFLSVVNDCRNLLKK
jgi:hypothetical protein